MKKIYYKQLFPKEGENCFGIYVTNDMNDRTIVYYFTNGVLYTIKQFDNLGVDSISSRPDAVLISEEEAFLELI